MCAIVCVCDMCVCVYLLYRCVCLCVCVFIHATSCEPKETVQSELPTSKAYPYHQGTSLPGYFSVGRTGCAWVQWR